MANKTSSQLTALKRVYSAARKPSNPGYVMLSLPNAHCRVRSLTMGKPPPLWPVALVIRMRALVCHTPAVITLGSEDNIPISAQFIGCIPHTRKAGFAVPLCIQKWASATHSEQHKRLSQYTKAFSKLQVMPIGAMSSSSIACVCVCVCVRVCVHVPVSVCVLYVGDGSVGLYVHLWRPEVDRGHSLIL